MKKWFCINITVLYLGGCICANQTSVRKATNYPIKYCNFMDSLLQYPKYNYSLVKENTKYFHYKTPQNMIEEFEKKGYRVVVADMDEGTAIRDSIMYVSETINLAKRLTYKKIEDSLKTVLKRQPIQNEIQIIYLKKIAESENCLH